MSYKLTKFNFTNIFETRIAPETSSDVFRKTVGTIESSFKTGDELPDWSVIFHFIKVHEKTPIVGEVRDCRARKEASSPVSTLKRLLENKDLKKHISGIDAASSEIACRPEAYARVFRYLKSSGYSATFHAGEDFYDIADGLRAISEAVLFLGLESGDRIGHGLALGIDADRYYADRHNTIAIPIQWMLDNVVWLFYKSREYNVDLDPQTNDFLITTAEMLLTDLGYDKVVDPKPSLHDYRQSMKLRGDAPELYASGTLETSGLPIPYGETWGAHAVARNDEVSRIRESSQNAVRLYHSYHYNPTIRREGRRVRSFKVPAGYVKAITGVQECMIREIAKRQICIECCPSSNVRIGRLKKFEEHPIFRFMPIKAKNCRYTLAVTVNTDDLGVFATSLPNEFSLLALALMKMKNADGSHVYSSAEVYEWIERVVENGHKFRFRTTSL